MKSNQWSEIEGERVIRLDTVAINPWKALLLRGRDIRVTTHRILVAGLPEIPLKSVTSCDVRNYWLMTPYVHVEYFDALGVPAQLRLIDSGIKFTDQRSGSVQRLHEAITKAWQEAQ